MSCRIWSVISLACAPWLAACTSLPDRDFLDENGSYQDELLDEGSFALFQHYGSSWRPVGYAWVGEDGQPTIWILRRAGTGGYPYRAPSARRHEVWTRVRRLDSDYESPAALMLGEKLEPGRFYALESTPKPFDLGTALEHVPVPEAGDDGLFVLEQEGEPLGYQWVSGEREVFLFRPGQRPCATPATHEVQERRATYERRRIGGADASVDRAIAERGEDIAEFEVWACHCRERVEPASSD